MKNNNIEYEGFELGAIRPPSEARSLLLRISRNCPWNKCTFCTLYKGEKFSVRSKETVLKDIDLIKYAIDIFRKIHNLTETEQRRELTALKKYLYEYGEMLYHCAFNWYKNGMKSIFLQDANSLVIKPEDMIEILRHIRRNFPEVERITSYARSHTIAGISDEHLAQMAEAGLNRVHVGFESASDKILGLINKGVDKETHIIAGQKIKKAGIELSEYFMPGIGGKEYSRENALDTAYAINRINPDFIRLRTLAVKDNSELSMDYKNGTFTRVNDDDTVKELLIFIENLEGITSTLKSDHILNLIYEVEGVFPQDKQKMLDALNWYLDLPENEKTIFKLGRRTGIMTLMDDLNDNFLRSRVNDLMKRNNITAENFDFIIDEIMKRFI